MSEESVSPTPLLDEWRGEVSDEAVAAAVEADRAQIADGSLRGFSDKDELLEYLQGARRHSA
jgi:hypothetical protein